MSESEGLTPEDMVLVMMFQGLGAQVAVSALDVGDREGFAASRRCLERVAQLPVSEGDAEVARRMARQVLDGLDRGRDAWARDN